MKIILEMSSYIFTIRKKKIGNVCDMCIMLIFEISISCVKKKIIINETALNINKGSDWKKFNKNLNIRGEKTINSILTSSECVNYDVT